MTKVSAAAAAPGTAEQVRELWFDTSRWPAFVDGFSHVVRADEGWPDRGEIVWDSTPHGRGRVVERPDGTFEDAQLRGTQSVRFEPLDGGVRVTLEMAYAIKERTVVTPFVDFFFVRRAMRDALTRTVRRFAAECRMDADLRAGSAR